MMLGNLRGVHIPHRKHTAQTQSVRMPAPAAVTLPLSMHIGRPADCVVAVGDHVDVGQVIGEAGSYVSAPVHASVSGKVKRIDSFLQANGAHCQAVMIESDGLMTVAQSVKPPVIEDYDGFLSAVRSSGIVGLGGATFPTAVKLDVKDPSRVQEIILNGSECEGYITSDHRTMLERTDEIIEGCALLGKWLGVQKIIIAIEDNKPDCIRRLKEAGAQDARIEVRSLPSMYPQGGEKILVYHITGKIIPEGKLPLDVGCLVLNVTTVAELARYCRTGMPLVEKCITVDGPAIREPKNVIAPIGTPIGDVFEFAGGFQSPAKKIIMGGPMMGIAQYTLTDPVLKGTNALLAFDEKGAKLPEPTACIRCGKCIDHCPMKLMPCELERAYEKNDIDALKKYKVGLCIECGCCAFQCPAYRPLVQANKLSKVLIREHDARMKTMKGAGK